MPLHVGGGETPVGWPTEIGPASDTLRLAPGVSKDRLYDGSIIEWGNRPELPIEK